MKPWKVLGLLATSRLRCWLLGHRETTQIHGEYVVTYCSRCFRATVEIVPGLRSCQG